MSDDEPLFRVVRGTPTPEELAALVGVLVTRSRPAGSAVPRAGSAWVRSGRPGVVSAAGLPARIGPTGWRTSAMPR